MLTTIILAAGVGKRLGDSIKEISKPLVSVAGKTLVHYMSDFAKALGSDRIVVVGGYRYELLKEEVNKIDSNIEIVENKDFEKQNLISFARGIETVSEGDLFVCNVDYIFKDHTIEAIKNHMNALGLYASFDLTGDADDVMKVKSDDARNMIDMSKKLTKYESIYTGMFFIPNEKLSLAKETVNELLNITDLMTQSVDVLLKELVAKGETVQVFDVGSPDWFEIDTPEEWEVAKNALEK